MAHQYSTTASPFLDEGGFENQVLTGVVVGLFLGLNDAGEPLVDYPGNPTGRAIVARAAAPLRTDDCGRDVALVFENGEPSRPIVLGLIQVPADPRTVVAVNRDHERLVLRAEREIVLECGDASITLTRAGKVIIRGKYVLSKSTGVNMIKGGVVHVN